MQLYEIINGRIQTQNSETASKRPRLFLTPDAGQHRRGLITTDHAIQAEIARREAAARRGT